MISDVLPWHYAVTTTNTVTLIRVEAMDKQALFDQAQAVGYAHAPAAKSHGQRQ
jgi:hypothetical protein